MKSFRSAITVLLSISLVLPYQTQIAQGAPTKKYKLSIGVISEYWNIYGETPKKVGDPSNCEDDPPLRSGTAVKIRDAKRTIIGSALLKWKVIKVRPTGAPLQTTYEPGDELPYEGICSLVAVVSNLPKTSFYEILLGKVDGGTYSFTDLSKQKWILILNT